MLFIIQISHKRDKQTDGLENRQQKLGRRRAAAPSTCRLERLVKPQIDSVARDDPRQGNSLTHICVTVSPAAL